MNHLDLNPDEQVGKMLKTLIRTIRPVILSEDLLWETLLIAYDIMKSEREFFIKLIQSMPRRLQNVLEKDGGHTKY